MKLTKLYGKTITILLSMLLLSNVFVFGTANAYALEETAALKSPENLVVKQTGSKGLELTWKKVDGAKGYEVFKAINNLGGYNTHRNINL